jgi:hypothetical protein
MPSIKASLRIMVEALWLPAVLLPGLAAAQTLPPGTVQGRLPPLSGPVESIPFATLTSQLGTTAGHFALWNSTTGTLEDGCGAPGTLAFVNGGIGVATALGNPAGGTGSFALNSQLASYLTPTGGTMSGNIAMGGNNLTPQGTGAVATTAAELNRTIWVNDYGAVCNGLTDDSAAFQAAINEGEATGYPIRFIGTCAIHSALSITAIINFGGLNAALGGKSSLVGTNVAADMIDISTGGGAPVYLHDMWLSYSAPANSGTSAITVGSPSSENGGSVFERLTINSNVSTGINFIRASGWSLLTSTVVGINQAVIVANLNNADSGDSTISGNLFEVGSGGDAIVYNSSGGLRVINNKFNGGGAVALALTLAPATTTADLFVTGNSFELGQIAVLLNRAGTTGGFGTVTITGNELAGANHCVQVPTDANGVWLNNLVITGNACNVGTGSTGAAVAFAIDSTQGATISNNFVQGFSSGTNQVFNIGSHGLTSTNCVVGITPHLAGATFTASALGSCTAIAPY